MTPLQLLRNIRNTPPDSMAGHIVAEHGGRMRWMPFVMLINLVWLFLWPMLAHASFQRVMLPTLLSVPVFLYLHMSTYYLDGPVRVRVRYVLGIALLAFALTPFNMSSIAYLIFSYFTISYLIRPRHAAVYVCATIVIYACEAILRGANTNSIVSTVVPTVLMGVVALYTSQASYQARTLRRSQAEIQRLATLAERERIGRDLHDLLGHTLSVVALKSELARKLIDRDIEAARTEIGEVERVARDALAQVRNAVAGIRSTALSAELAAATSLLDSQGFKVKADVETVTLPHDRETALALSLREATTNVRRHSGAGNVTIRLRRGAGAVVMEVEDDGRGGRIVPGNGLNGMRERLDSVGGTLAVLSNKDGGTLLRASVPEAA